MIEDSEIDNFISLYEQRALKRNVGGLSAESSFWIWETLKEKTGIKHVIESGIWRGATTWLISRTKPEMTIDCLDPLTGGFDSDLLVSSLEALKVMLALGAKQEMIDEVTRDGGKWWAHDIQPPSVQKSRHDIMNFEPRKPRSGETLVILDDHQDILPRLKRCIELGVDHVIIDDNHPWVPSPHKGFYHYLKTVGVSVAEHDQFVEFQNKHIDFWYEFEHLKHGYFVPFERHQYLIYVKLKLAGVK